VVLALFVAPFFRRGDGVNCFLLCLFVAVVMRVVVFLCATSTQLFSRSEYPLFKSER
jgi:hypothetical protein